MWKLLDDTLVMSEGTLKNEWQILDTADGKALVLAKSPVDYRKMPYASMVFDLCYR